MAFADKKGRVPTARCSGDNKRMAVLKRTLTLLMLTALIFTAPSAFADDASDQTDIIGYSNPIKSILTASIGTQLGMTHTQQLEATPQMEFVTELEVQVKLFTFLGVELTYNPSALENEPGNLAFNSRLRLTGQLYFLPTDVLSLYLAGGIGADDFNGLATLTADSNTYHGGIGAEFYIGEHVAIGAEYLMVVPGVRSIQKTVVAQALESGLIENGGNVEALYDDMNPTDFISPSNFQVTIGARYYF
jgi:hypothetical protein